MCQWNTFSLAYDIDSNTSDLIWFDFDDEDDDEDEDEDDDDDEDDE